MRKPYVAVLLLIWVGQNAAHADVTIWSQNQLSNGTAENFTLKDWQVSSPLIAISESQQTRSGVVTPRSGRLFFNFATASAAESGVLAAFEMSQRVDVSQVADQIDRGMLVAKALTSFQTEDRPSLAGSDRAFLKVNFLDMSGNKIDGWSATLESPNLQWLETKLEGFVPLGTRSIELVLRGEKEESTFINAFFDDVELRLGTDNSARTYKSIAVLPDLTGDGIAETVVLSDFTHDPAGYPSLRHVIWAIFLDGASGRWLKHIRFLYPGVRDDLTFNGWTAHDLATVDVDFDGFPELAVLAQSAKTTRVMVEIRSANTGSRMKLIRFFNDVHVQPIALTIGDVDANGMPDIGVVAARPDGRTAVEYRDAATGAKLPDQVARRIWLPKR